MSVRVMTWVFDHSRAEGSDRLVLLAIADRANDEGGDAWPSLAWIAQKANLSERTVRRCLRSLEENGEIETLVQAGGNKFTRHDRRPNAYRVVMHSGGSTGGHTCPPDEPRGVKYDTTGGQVRPNGGSLVSAYTSNNHPDTSAPSGRMDESVLSLGKQKVRELRGS